MKKIDIPFIILSLLFLFSGCKEEEIPLTIIEGHVLEYGTNEPIPNAEVILYLSTSTGGLTGTVSTFRKDTIYTNQDGHYFLEFDDEGASIMDLSVFHENYFEKESHQIVANIFARRNNNVDIIMDPHAWLKLHIKNMNPVNESDNIRYNGNWGGGGPQDNPGAGVDFFDTKLIRGNREFPIYWWVTKNGITTSYSDSIFITSHETTLFEIFY